MSKKRVAVSIVVVIVAVIINILIINYQLPARNYEVQFNITMTSDSKNEIQLYYLYGNETLDSGFREDNSKVVTYKNVGIEQVLTYEIPGDVTYIRLNIGKGQADTTITRFSAEMKNTERDLTDLVVSNIETTQDSLVERTEEGLRVKTQDEDPQVVFNTENWNLSKLITEATSSTTIPAKILLCVCLDIIFLAVLLFTKKFMIIPHELMQNRKLILQLSKNDFKTKFAGSYLGIFWAFVQPIVTVLVYWFVFEKGLKAGGMNTSAGIEVPYVLWLVAGLVPWFFFQEALNGGTNALLEYSYLVKKVVFKISILPIVKVISALFVHGFFILFTLMLYCGYQYYPDAYTLQIFYYSAAMFLFTLGLSYATCALVVFFRDLTQIINIALQVGVWMTPIMWNIDTMELSPILLTIFKLNPMYYIVAGYRDALINKVWFWESPGITVYFWIMTVILFGIGITIFRRLKVHFADVL